MSGADVDAAVHDAVGGEGVDAVAKVAGNPAAGRPNRRHGGEQRVLLLEIRLQLLKARLLTLGRALQSIELVGERLGVDGIGEHGARGGTVLLVGVGHPDRPDGQMAFRVGESGDGAQLLIEVLDAIESGADAGDALADTLEVRAQADVFRAQCLVLREVLDRLVIVDARDRGRAQEEDEEHQRAREDPAGDAQAPRLGRPVGDDDDGVVLCAQGAASDLSDAEDLNPRRRIRQQAPLPAGGKNTARARDRRACLSKGVLKKARPGSTPAPPGSRKSPKVFFIPAHPLRHPVAQWSRPSDRTRLQPRKHAFSARDQDVAPRSIGQPLPPR